jgi:TRAP-type transport system periplasmic protein
VIEDHCTPEWAETMSSGWADVEAAGREKIAADPAHTLHKPDEAQAQAWRDAAAPLTDEWMQIMSDQGRDGEAILQGLIDALKKYDSYAG